MIHKYYTGQWSKPKGSDSSDSSSSSSSSTTTLTNEDLFPGEKVSNALTIDRFYPITPAVYWPLTFCANLPWSGGGAILEEANSRYMVLKDPATTGGVYDFENPLGVGGRY